MVMLVSDEGTDADDDDDEGGLTEGVDDDEYGCAMLSGMVCIVFMHKSVDASLSATNMSEGGGAVPGDTTACVKVVGVSQLPVFAIIGLEEEMMATREERETVARDTVTMMDCLSADSVASVMLGRLASSQTSNTVIHTR